MYFSDYINVTKKGHSNFEFVDVCLDKDNKVFIDPALLELSQDEWGKDANACLQSYFDAMFTAMKDGNEQNVLCHGGEQNATKLGYGSTGVNGKGKTKTGLYDALCGLKTLLKQIPTISKPMDIPVLVEGFAEDCMSDLITNILHEHLNSFTAEQMYKYGIPANGKVKFWTWCYDKKEWKQVEKVSWLYKGREILMVPKGIVRTNYLFKAHQYLYSIITERMRDENGLENMSKKDIWARIPRNKGEHWEYDEVISYSKSHPDALVDYHNRIPYFYNRANGTMDDDALDLAIYGRIVSDVA